MAAMGEGASGLVSEVVGGLDRAVARLVVAGAGSAKGDVELERVEKALEALGRSSPALAQAAGAVAALRAARGRAASEALLALSAHAARLRGALVRPARAEGALAAMPGVEPLDTPLEHHEIEALSRALAADSAAGAKVLREAIERGRARDLRLLDRLIDALSSSADTADVVVRALSLYEQTAAARLRAMLSRTADEQVARLRQRGKSKELAQALVERRRAAAVRALAGIDPEGARPIALAMAREPGSRWVRRSAVLALGSCCGDEVLELLLSTLEGDDFVESNAAAEALGRLDHPRAGERLAETFRRAVTARKQAKATSPGWLPADLVGARSLDALFARRDAASLALALSIWRSPLERALRQRLGDRLLEGQGPEALRALAEGLEHRDAEVRDVAKKALLKLGPGESFAELSAPLRAAIGDARQVREALSVVGTLAAQPKGQLSEAWASLLAEVARRGAEGPDGERLAMECLTLLALEGRADEALVAAVLDRAPGWPWKARADGNTRTEWLWHSLCEVIEAAGLSSLSPRLRATRERLPEKGRAWIAGRLDQLLEALGGAKPAERKRPRAPAG